jgi:predicted transcriptional regulator
MLLSVLDIIASKPKGEKPTTILRHANLNWSEWKRIREDLLRCRLIFVNSERQHRYQCTENGLLVVAHYRNMLTTLGVEILSL